MEDRNRIEISKHWMYGRKGFFRPNHTYEYGFHLEDESTISFPTNRRNKKALQVIWEEFKKGNDEGYVTLSRNDTEREIVNEGTICVIVNGGEDRKFEYIQSYRKRSFPFDWLFSRCEVSEL